MRGSINVPRTLKRAVSCVCGVLLALLATVTAAVRRHRSAQKMRQARRRLRDLYAVKTAGRVVEFRMVDEASSGEIYLFPIDHSVRAQGAEGALALRLRAPEALFHERWPVLVFYPDCLCWMIWRAVDPDPRPIEVRIDQHGPWYRETCPTL